MKILVLSLVIAGMMITAGCTAPAVQPVTPAPTASEKVLPMHANATIGSGNKTMNVYIDSIELDPKKENESGRTITIYVAIENTGTENVMMVYYSKLTDKNGRSYGGINATHGGNGARTAWMYPGKIEAARDYIDKLTNQDLGAISNGAVLDVYFMEKPADNVAVSLNPDYHVAWTIEPGSIVGLP